MKSIEKKKIKYRTDRRPWASFGGQKAAVISENSWIRHQPMSGSEAWRKKAQIGCLDSNIMLDHFCAAPFTWMNSSMGKMQDEFVTLSIGS